MASAKTEDTPTQAARQTALATTPVPPTISTKAAEPSKPPAPAVVVMPTANAAVECSRFVVQIGAFAEDVKVKEVRLKLEKAGFKTYLNVANTKEGPRTRVRVGPFASKDEAEKIANKNKQLQFQPQVLTLSLCNACTRGLVRDSSCRIGVF